MSKRNVIIVSLVFLVMVMIGSLLFFNNVFMRNDTRLNNEIQLGDRECVSNSDCGFGKKCKAGKCKDDSSYSGGTECVSNSECSSGKRCYHLHCVPQCTDISDSSQCSSTGCYWDSSTGKCLKTKPASTPTPTPSPTNTPIVTPNTSPTNTPSPAGTPAATQSPEPDYSNGCCVIDSTGKNTYTSPEFCKAFAKRGLTVTEGPCPTNTVSPTQQPAPVTCSSITNGSACFNAGCYWDYGKSECLNLKPSFTPIPTTQPTVTPSATPISSDPEITCLNSVYSGSLIYKPIAECSNGTFSSGENIYKTTVIGAHNVTCHGTNGKNVTKTCWLYRSSDEIPGGVKEQNSSNPEITCVSSAFSGFLNPQIIAECSNGTFSNGDNVYKTTVIGVQTLTCYGNNGQNVTKACRLYQSIDVIPEAERPHNKDNNDKSQNVKKKLGLGADCNEDSECESNYCNKILFGLMGVCAGIGGDPNNRDNANFYVYTENTSYSSNVPDDCQYIDGYLVTPEASENSSDRVCQYNIVDDTSKCDGSDSCYRVVEYVKEKHESHDNKNLKMAIFIALSGIIVASVVYAYITYVRKK